MRRGAKVLHLLSAHSPYRGQVNAARDATSAVPDLLALIRWRSLSRVQEKRLSNAKKAGTVGLLRCRPCS